MQALKVIGIMWAALAVGTLQVLAVIVGTVVLLVAVHALVNFIVDRQEQKWRQQQRRRELQQLGRDLARDRSMGHLYYCEKCRKVMWGKPGWHPDDDGMLCFQPLAPYSMKDGAA